MAKFVVSVDFKESCTDEVLVRPNSDGPSHWFTDLVRPLGLPERRFLPDGTYANREELMAMWREQLP